MEDALLCLPCATPTVVTHRLAVDITVHLIYEGAYNSLLKFPQLTDVNSSVAVSKEQHEAPHLTPDGLRHRQMQFGCCLLQLETAAGTKHVLLDTACSDIHPPGYLDGVPPHPLLPTLEAEIGVSRNDIVAVVHSHTHPDHIGNNIVQASPGGGDAAYAPAFPNAKHYLSQAEFEYAYNEPQCPWHKEVHRRFDPLMQAGMVHLLDSSGPVDEEALPHLKILMTQGHTIGHVTVLISSLAEPGTSAMYIGDALHFPAQVSNPFWSPTWDCCLWTPEKSEKLKLPTESVGSRVTWDRGLTAIAF